MRNISQVVAKQPLIWEAVSPYQNVFPPIKKYLIA